MGILGLLKRKVVSVPQSEQLARTPEPPLPKAKVLSPDHKILNLERIKVSESRTFARKRGSEREYGEERVDSTVKEGGFQGGKEGKQEEPP